MVHKKTWEELAFAIMLGTLLSESGISTKAGSLGRYSAPGAVSSSSTRHTDLLLGPGTETWMPERRESSGYAERVMVSSWRTLPASTRFAATLRGGQATRRAADTGTDEEDQLDGLNVEPNVGDEDEEATVEYDEEAVEWMMQQLCMYQTRTALISRPLAAKVR